jgi:hypothetical protein
MPMIRTLVSAALFAVAVSAQVTIADGNTNAVVGALSATSQLPPDLELRGDVLLVNHAFQHGWYYRVAGDTQEFSFRDVGGVVDGNAGPDHGDRDWANVDSRGLLKASLDLDCYDAGPASGVVISRMTIMNRSAAPVTIDMFCYSDLDIAGSFGNDSVVGNAGAHFVSDPSGVQVEVRAIGSDVSVVGSFPTVRNLLTNTTVDDLVSALPPFLGDYSGAFQWQNRTLQPFEVRTFQVLFAIDTAAVANPLIELYGAGNGSSFEIQMPTQPLQDNTQVRPLIVQMKGALPGVEQRTIIGLDPWIPPQPFIPGLDLWVLPLSIFGVFGGLTSPTGEAQEMFIIPPAPYFAGFSVYFQVFSVDGAAPNGFAYFSPGLRIRIGKL